MYRSFYYFNHFLITDLLPKTVLHSSNYVKLLCTWSGGGGGGGGCKGGMGFLVVIVFLEFRLCSRTENTFPFYFKCLQLYVNTICFPQRLTLKIHKQGV